MARGIKVRAGDRPDCPQPARRCLQVSLSSASWLCASSGRAWRPHPSSWRDPSGCLGWMKTAWCTRTVSVGMSCRPAPCRQSQRAGLIALAWRCPTRSRDCTPQVSPSQAGNPGRAIQCGPRGGPGPHRPGRAAARRAGALGGSLVADPGWPSPALGSRVAANWAPPVVSRRPPRERLSRSGAVGAQPVAASLAPRATRSASSQRRPGAPGLQRSARQRGTGPRLLRVRRGRSRPLVLPSP